MTRRSTRLLVKPVGLYALCAVMAFAGGSGAAVAAGPVGRTASASTDAQLKAEIYSYSRSRGLFAGIALDGAALQIAREDNTSYYAQPGLTARQIFVGENSNRPATAEQLSRRLSDYVTQ